MDPRELEALYPYIGHRYRPVTEFGGWVYTALVNSAFCRVTALGQQLVPEVATGMPRRHPGDPVFVYVGRHRSEFDYTLLLTTLFQVGKFALTQAGDNLFIGPLDPLLRAKGAFKVLRFKEGEVKTYYAPSWLKDSLRKQWAQVRGLRRLQRRKPVTITREGYRELYPRYIAHLVRGGYDLQIFPEYEWSASGKKRVGRSKTGLLNPFAPAVFEALLAAQEETGRPVYLVPVSVNYERVPEDTNIRRIQAVREYLARRLRMGHALGSAVSYIFDFAYNLALCLPGLNVVPRQRRPAAVVHLGAPYRLGDPVGEERARAEALHGALAALHAREVGTPPAASPSAAERAAAVAWDRVGALEVPYVCQLVAYSALEPLLGEGWHRLMRQVLGREGREAEYGEGLPESVEVSMADLEARYRANYDRLCAKERSIHEVVGLDGGPVPLREALAEMDRVFSNRLTVNPVFDREEGRLVIKDLPTFVQYANHVLHLFQPPGADEGMRG